MEDVRSCIHRVPIFQVLPEDNVLRLQRAMHHGKLSPGKSSSMPGSGGPLVVVARGLLKLTRVSRSGREQVVRELGPGEFFGEMAFLPPWWQRQTCGLTETDACLLRRDAVQAELAAIPAIAGL